MNIGHSFHSIQIENERVFSPQYGDIYFSTENAIEESDYVFLQGNNLYERFSKLKKNDIFSIGETGFGTGLNFVLTAFQFIKHSEGILHYHSAEKHPLSVNQIESALNSTGIIKFSSFFEEFLCELIQQLKNTDYRRGGFTTVFLAKCRIRLTLMIGDASDCLQNLDGAFDAWYLDGFAPAKNPEMWSDDLFKNIGRLSRSSTTLATFTSAGFVRRGLSQNGFQIHKVRGYGQKKEMITGVFSGRNAKDYKKSFGIIGAGIAGLTTAWSLSRRGIFSRVYDASLKGSGSSGNRAALLMPSITKEPTNQSLLTLSALNTTGSFMDSQKIDQIKKGIICKQKDRIFDYCTSHGLSSHSFRAFNNELVFFKNGRAIEPKKFLNSFLNPNYEISENVKIESIDLSSGGITLNSNRNHFDQDAVVICAANASNSLHSSIQIPTRPVRGQLLELPLEIMESKFKKIKAINSSGYIIRTENSILIGATFDMHLSQKERLPDRDKYLLNLADSILGGFASFTTLIDQEKTDGSVCFRCQSRDYLPVTGQAIIHKSEFLQNTEPYSDMTAYQLDRVQNVYFHTGHGSRGLSTALLCAESLADEITDKPGPIERNLKESMDPARFWIRELKRNREHRRWWQS